MSGMVNTKTATLDELAIAVIEWAHERDLTHPDNAFKQILKVMEEVGELSGALAKHREDDVKDAIGDVLVTMIILAVQLGYSSTECLALAYNEIAERKGKTVDGVFIKDGD